MLGGVTWRWLGYRRLAEHIEGALPVEPSYEHETMRRYATIARGLADLVGAVAVRGLHEPFQLPEVATAGAPPRLVASLAKSRARQTADLVDQAASDRLDPGLTDSGFNGQALVEWKTSPQACGCSLGWQLQGGDFRLFVASTLNHGTSAELRESRSAHAWKAHREWFDWTRVDGVLGGAVTADLPREPRKLNPYAPDFVYRYKRLPSITVQQLVDVTERLADLVETRTSFNPLSDDSEPGGRDAPTWAAW